MAKKWRFLHKLRKFFLCQRQSQPDRKMLTGASATQCTVHDLEEQMKHATDAATAAAEAAAVAVQAAAAVARLVAQQMHGKEVYDWAATRIQTCFRGYIARKALRALKAIVRLQAIARGRALRRQLRSRLKRSSSFTKLTQVGQILDPGSDTEKGSRLRDIVVDTNMELKRSTKVRQLQFAEVLEETPSRRYNRKQGYLARQSWEGERLQRSAVLENSLPYLNMNARVDAESSENSPFSITRRSCSQRRARWGDEESSSPGYMAATASARAKMRSTSTPRRRIGYPDQHHSDRRRDAGL